MRRLNDLKALGDAWAEKTKGAEELAAWRKIQDANARVLLRKWDERERALDTLGAICPCGKRSYKTKKDAEAKIAALTDTESLSIYRCAMGHPVYHLKSSGRSTREGRPR